MLSCLSDKGDTNYVTDYFSATVVIPFSSLGAQRDHRYPPEPGHPIYHAFLCRTNSLLHTLGGEWRKIVYSSDTSESDTEKVSSTV